MEKAGVFDLSTTHMKTLFAILAILVAFQIYGQSKAKITFYDACKGETVSLPYELWSMDDSLISVEARKKVKLPAGFYQLSVAKNWKNLTTTFYFNITIEKEQKKLSETLYLGRVRLYGPAYITNTENQFVHYQCEALCNGLIEDFDQNGVLRFKGWFKNGIPVTNLKYYDKEGKLTQTHVYEHGKLTGANSLKRPAKKEGRNHDFLDST